MEPRNYISLAFWARERSEKQTPAVGLMEDEPDAAESEQTAAITRLSFEMTPESIASAA